VAGIVTTGELTGAGVAAFTIHADNATMPSMVANSQLDAKIDCARTISVPFIVALDGLTPHDLTLSVVLLGGGKPYYTANQGKAWTDASYTILNTPDGVAFLYKRGNTANTLKASFLCLNFRTREGQHPSSIGIVC